MKNYKRIIFLLFVTIGLSFVFVSAQAQTVMQKLKSNSQTTQFANALENADIDEKINRSGTFTLLAPSNNAFNNLSSVEKRNDNLLLNHIFTGMATERSLKAMENITCLSGRNLTIENNQGQDLLINSIRIVNSNIRADNGVIHVIDGVIK